MSRNTNLSDWHIDQWRERAEVAEARSAELEARVGELEAALERAQAAIWDSFYGKGLDVAYARNVDDEIRQALAKSPAPVGEAEREEMMDCYQFGTVAVEEAKPEPAEIIFRSEAHRDAFRAVVEAAEKWVEAMGSQVTPNTVVVRGRFLEACDNLAKARETGEREDEG